MRNCQIFLTVQRVRNEVFWKFDEVGKNQHKSSCSGLDIVWALVYTQVEFPAEVNRTSLIDRFDVT